METVIVTKTTQAAGDHIFGELIDTVPSLVIVGNFFKLLVLSVDKQNLQISVGVP